MKQSYFVTYCALSLGNTTFQFIGNTVVDRPQPIRSLNDIRELEDKTLERLVSEVSDIHRIVVLNFVQLN
jgi:hypothetical protein